MKLLPFFLGEFTVSPTTPRDFRATPAIFEELTGLLWDSQSERYHATLKPALITIWSRSTSPLTGVPGHSMSMPASGRYDQMLAASHQYRPYAGI